jgi:signal transduction histidine kinase
MIAGLARLRLETSGGVILVEVPDCATPSVAWQTGAQLAATGVCLAEHSPEAMARRFPQPDRITIYVLGPTAVELLASAPWWTPRRLAFAMGGLLVVLAAAGFVVLRLGAKTQRLSARGRELARAELLRTTQLHEQLATQHEQQLTFQAVLHERQRLAQELHDSMEQQFASLSLHAEAALAEADSTSETGRGLGGLRRFIEESRGEVRRCIWGLRARALEQRGIGAALHELARQHNAGAGPHLTVVESGTAIPLETTRENHLFRFAQEAVGNALKHAKATEIGLFLEWTDGMLRLVIQDNGCGLPAGSPVPAALHHRAIALSAAMETAAVQPSGTQVTLILSLEPGTAEI